MEIISSKRFITYANFLKILPSTRVLMKYSLKEVRYYDKTIDELSNETKQQLYWVVFLLTKPEELAEFLKTIKAQEDSFTQMFPPTPPAFHSVINCSALTANYVNILLPQGIRGDTILTEICREEFNTILDKYGLSSIKNLTEDFIRPLFSELVDILKTHQEFVKRFQAKKLRLEELKETDFHVINFENSGKVTVKTIEAQIEEALRDFNITFLPEARKRGVRREHVIRDFKKNYFKTKYEEQIKGLIIQFNICKYNPSLQFNEQTLKLLGFHGCSFCMKDELVQTENETLHSLNNSAHEFDVVEYIENLKDVYEFNSYYGPFKWMNTPDSALETSDMKGKDPGLYYGLHKHNRRLQAFLRIEGKFFILPLPQDGFGEILITDFSYVAIVKRKNFGSEISGIAEELLIIPILGS